MTDLKPSFPSDSDVLAVFHEELARAAQRPDLPCAGPALWRQFAAYYQALARLWRFLVCFLVMLLLGSQVQAIDSDDLAIAVTASSDPVVPGNILVYQLTATNRGTISTSGGVTVTAFSPGGTRVAGVTDGGVCSPFCDATGATIRWSLSDLPAGGSRTVGLSVRVFGGGFGSAPPDGSLIAQQATVTSEGASASAVAASRVCSGGGVSCDFDQQADLSVTKADAPDPVFVGQPLTYTLTMRNNGPNNATGVTVTDPLPGGVVFVSAAANQGGCSGTATVTCSLGTLANGASATVTIVVTPTFVGALSNTATVAGSPSDPNPGNNSATSATTVLSIPPIRADLALTQTDAPDPGAVNDPLVYTLTATNHGPSPATGVQLTDNLPPGVLLIGPPIPSQGTCSGTGPVVCQLGTLASGASATVTLNVLPTQEGTVSNAASVVGVEPDIAPGNNSASNTTTVNQVAVLPSPQGNCNRSRCGVRLTCTLGAPCAGRRVTLFVSARNVRGNEAAAIKATNRIKFAAGIANVPPGGPVTVRLRPTSRAKAIIRTSRKKTLRGVMEIRNTAGAVVSTTAIRIRLR